MIRIDKMDERRLIEAMMYGRTRSGSLGTAWQLADDLGIPYKRARYIIRDKWLSRGWVDYGVSWRCATLEDAGVSAVLSIRMCICGWEGMVQDLVDGVIHGEPYCCPRCGCTARDWKYRGFVERARTLAQAKFRTDQAKAKIDRLLSDLSEQLRKTYQPPHV